MRVAMLIEAGACVAIGVVPGVAIWSVAAAAAQLGGTAATPALLGIPALTTLSLSAAVLAAVVALLLVLRRQLLRRRLVRRGPTWDCGYALPAARMQYTAASFAQPVLDPFAALLRTRAERIAVAGEFPQAATEEVQLTDPGEAAVQAALRALVAPLARVRSLQRGPVQLYLLYVLLTLLVLLIWQVRS